MEVDWTVPKVFDTILEACSHMRHHFGRYFRVNDRRLLGQVSAASLR